MHKEIERKFLVSHTDFLRDTKISHTHIEQSYLAPDTLHYEFAPGGGGYTLKVYLEEEPLYPMLSTHVQESDYSALKKILSSTEGAPTVRPRIRILDNEKAVLTLKGKAHGLSRDEFEVPLLLEAALAASRHAKSCLRKTRYYVAVGQKTFEVDVYEGPLLGLVTAEVEFSETEDPMEVELPEWIGRDVSEDIEYSNARLAERGIGRNQTAC